MQKTAPVPIFEREMELATAGNSASLASSKTF
jgi:hypothetical protein